MVSLLHADRSVAKKRSRVYDDGTNAQCNQERITKLCIILGVENLRSNRHQQTMRTIEIAVNDSAHRCLVLASIFFERPTHDLVAMIPGFALPISRLIRIIRI